jgi:hypothetical protein
MFAALTLTSDGKPAATTRNSVIGMYASTARRKTKTLNKGGDPTTHGPYGSRCHGWGTLS